MCLRPLALYTLRSLAACAPHALAISSIAWLVGCGSSNGAGPSHKGDAGDAGNEAAAQMPEASAGTPETGPATGTLGGACYGNGTCNFDAGLACSSDGVCVVAPLSEAGGDDSAADSATSDSPTAAAGTQGGPCYGNGTCNMGLVCNAAGLCDVSMTYCGTHPNKPLPYNIETDFNQILSLGRTIQGVAVPGTSVDFTMIPNPDCAGSMYPPIPDAGATLFTRPQMPAPDAAAEASAAEGGGSVEGGNGEASSAAEGGTAEGGAGDDGSTPAFEAGGDDGSSSDAVSSETGATQEAGSTDAGANSEASSSDAAQAAADGGLPACFEFLYNPICDYLAPGSTAPCYGGAIFQSAPSNAGPGICIAPGATKVTFSARASRNSVFKLGSIKAGGTTEFYLGITTQWMQYSVSIPAGLDYNSSSTAGGVWNGFSVVAEAPNHIGGTYIQIKDIVWSM